ncbi:fimbria/pilus outer membrane usher protein [Serratia ureilytica]|uniref:fimbria/pilus outer membrane usher protein n=1 Tax=Serratia ureilytica TaxID=300181 RepID=UPI001F3CFF6D|nr:fimbria/pilus outer membrane usher protein [Serratia ureilytica]
MALALSALLLARAEASGFDVKTLEQLGYNADIANFFSSARFLPGVHRVTLEVNAAQRYQEEVRFGQEGELCLDAQLAQMLQLRIDAQLGACERIEFRWPQAQVKVFPGAFRVEITLPQDAFDPDKQRREQRGGYAVLMNYDLYGNRVQGRYGDRQTFQAMLEPGVNISNWVIRNRSSYSKDELGDRLDVYETSATRDFPQWGAFVQVGEFGAGGALSGGLPITGVQLSSEGSRQSGATLAVPLQGSVSSQATVEVKQRGQVVYRTLLPAGPFTFNTLGQAMAGVETEIGITDAEGHQQRFTVTPGRGDEQDSQDNYQVALGRYRTYGARSDTGAPPALLMGEKNLALGSAGQIGFGTLLSTRYQRLAWQGIVGNETGGWGTGGITFSRGRRHGVQLDAQGQQGIGRNLTLSLTSVYRTSGFRGADEALGEPIQAADEAVRLRYAGGAGLTWNAPAWGSLTYNLSHERYHAGGQQNWMHTLSYGRRLGGTSLTLSLQSSAYDRSAFYAGVNIPLGGGSVGSRMQVRQNNRVTLGSSWRGAISPQMSGTLDVARDPDGEYQTSGNLSGSTAYTRLSAGVSHSSQGSTALTLASSGALGVANGTLVTSAQRVGDTLAVVSVPGQSGVVVSGAGGGVTDYAGDVLLPSAAPYMPLKAEIDTLSLPLNLRLNSTGTEFRLARGTVATREFRVTEVRQLLLTLRDAQGETLPTGASVHDDKGRLLGTLIGDGNLMLVNEDIGAALRVRRVNMNECRVSYEVPTMFDSSVLYEERDAVCQ